MSLSRDWFALKSLYRTDDAKDAFDREVRMFKRFDGLHHSHIVSMLATYTHRDVFNLVFPYAESDLYRYWERNPGPLSDPSSVSIDDMRWMSAQILGIAGAVDMIHNPPHLSEFGETLYGRHGDIKPDNILWFRSDKNRRGIFAITDFGLSSIHRERSRSNEPNNGTPFTPSYRPPECDMEGCHISRSFDIWSLGCLYLELASWILGGFKLLEQFELARMTQSMMTGVTTSTFFDIKVLETKKHQFMVKPSVKEVCPIPSVTTIT